MQLYKKIKNGETTKAVKVNRLKCVFKSDLK